MTVRIPIARPEFGEAEWKAVRKVIESGWVAQGPAVAEFETSVAAYCGAVHAVAVSSCTAALHLALLCAGIVPGDEVIVPSMSFIATANAVTYTGARPIFAEIDADTFNLNPLDVLTRVSPRTKAIVLVHQLGLPADLVAFREIAQEHGLALIEDAACALGSTYQGTPIGGQGELVCFSFHPRKVITTGEGGMVLTSSSEYAERLRRLRQHGMTVSDLARHLEDRLVRESYSEVGFNYRMSDIQAAVGIEQMRRLPEILKYRRTLSAEYDKAFLGSDLVGAPVRSPGVDWNVQTYAVRLMGVSALRRDEIMQTMLDRGIATRPGVMAIHREPAYAGRNVSLPVTDRASESSLMLPLHAGMDANDVQEISCDLLSCLSDERSSD